MHRIPSCGYPSLSHGIRGLLDLAIVHIVLACATHLATCSVLLFKFLYLLTVRTPVWPLHARSGVVILPSACAVARCDSDISHVTIRSAWFALPRHSPTSYLIILIRSPVQAIWLSARHSQRWPGIRYGGKFPTLGDRYPSWRKYPLLVYALPGASDEIQVTGLVSV